MTFVDDHRKTFDAAEFCEKVKAGVGEGRISSNIAIRDASAVSTAVVYLRQFVELASAAGGPDVVAAYVAYSPGASEIFTALRPISTNPELVSVAVECLTLIVRYSLDVSKPQQSLEQVRSVVKEVVKSRAVLFYDIMVTDGKACAKKALNLLRLVASCHRLLAKELVNRFDLASKSMAPSLCSVSNNHCRVPFLDLMFTLLAAGERDVLHYFAGKGREVIVICLRTIQERATLEATGSFGGSTKTILWKQGKARQSKQPKVLPSHVQKRELVAAINFILATEKHLFIGLNWATRGVVAHPVPTILATLAATEVPPLTTAPREVREEHEVLRSTAARLFVAIAKNPRTLGSGEVVRALNNKSFNFGNEAVVNFVSKVVQEKPEISSHLLEAGRILSAPPALTLRWFGYFSIIACCIPRLQSPINTFKEKQFFERCLGHSDSLIRHLGSVLAISFCKVLEKRMTSEHKAEDFVPSFETIQKIVKSGANETDLFHRLLTSYQSILRKQIAGSDVKLMIASVDAAGEDIMAATGTIEAALRAAPYSAVRKVVHKGYLSKLIMKASRSSQTYEALKLWRVCALALRSTDLFQPGTDAEIDICLSVLSSLGKEIDEPAKAFEAMIAQALEMPYGLYDRLHSDEWSEECTTIKTSHLGVATVIKVSKLIQKRSAAGESESSNLVESTLQRMALSTVATLSVFHRQYQPNSYLAKMLPSVLNPQAIWWQGKGGKEDHARARYESHRIARKLIQMRGTYPATKFLKLIDALLALDTSMEIKSRHEMNPKKATELGLVWNSWCEYWLPDGDHLISKGVLRFLMETVTARQLELKTESDLRALKKASTAGEYRFAVALMMQAAAGISQRQMLYNEILLLMSDMTSDHSLRPEELEFIYESILRLVSKESDWNTGDIHKVLSYCFSVLSKWNGLPKWEVHVAYSIALVRAFLSHSSTDISVCSKVFAAKQSVATLPSLTKLTNDTVKSLLSILNHSPSLRRLAIAQVYDWSEKEHRSCDPVALRLVKIALHETDGREKYLQDRREKLIERFSKASMKSKTIWLSNDCSEEDMDNIHALSSIASVIAQTKKGCENFLHGLFRVGCFSRNSSMLLGNILESSEVVGVGLEVSNQSLGKLLGLITRQLVGFKALGNGYPDQADLQILECIMRHLRLRKFPFHDLSSSINEDMAALCKILTNCAQSRCFALIQHLEMLNESLSLNDAIDIKYIASVFACLSEILRLDLSLESNAKELLIQLSMNDGQIVRLCLQSPEFQKLFDGSFPQTKDAVFHLAILLRSAFPWLSHSQCDDSLARAILCIHGTLSSQGLEIASRRSERQSAVRECVRDASSYIRANDLVTKSSPSVDRILYPVGPEAATALNGLSKPLLEEAADYILTNSYNCRNVVGAPITDLQPLDPTCILHTFLLGCRQALSQPQAPVLDLHRITRDGLLALIVTGTSSAHKELRTLSLACLAAFAAVVGPSVGVPNGSASGLYKDRRQLAFLLELLRDSISDPLAPVLPLFAVWFRTCIRIALCPGHAANKAVGTLLMRGPCMDVSDCYGLSYFFNFEGSSTEVQATRLLAFEVIQQGVRSQRDLSVLRRRRVFDKIFMFAASAMGSESSLRIAALKSLGAILARDQFLDITDELMSSHGISGWLVSGATHTSETIEERVTKLNVLRSAAEGFAQRSSNTYAPVLAEALALFGTSRLKPKSTTRGDIRLYESIAACATSIAQISPTARFLFRIDFAHLWTEYRSGKPLSPAANNDFVRCICRQQNVLVEREVLEILVEHTMDKQESKGSANSNSALATEDLSLIQMFVAECLLAVRLKRDNTGFVTSYFCNLLAMAMCEKPSIWMLVSAVATLDICDSLSGKVVACTDKIPAYLPLQLKPQFEKSFSVIVDEMRLTIMEELVSLGNRLMAHGQEGGIVMNGESEDHRMTNGVH